MLTPRRIETSVDDNGKTIFYYIDVIEHNREVLDDSLGNQISCHRIKAKAEDFESMNPSERESWVINIVKQKIESEKPKEESSKEGVTDAIA